MNNQGSSNSEPQKILVERDSTSSTGWAVAMILVVMFVGFAFFMYSERTTFEQNKLEQAMDDIKENSTISVDPKDPNVKVELPKVEVPRVEIPEVDTPVNETPQGETNEEPAPNLPTQE